MTVNVLMQFVAFIEEMRTQAEIVVEFERVLERYGFDCYGIVRQPKPGETPTSLLLAGRWPGGWPQIYLSKKYVLIDPTIRYLGHAQQAFRWRDTLAAFRSDPHRKRMERMMADARSHGLQDGYVFPVHGRRGLLGSMTLCGRPVDLSPLEMTLLEAIARKIFWKLLELADRARLADLSRAVDMQMTRREMEALVCLAEGMTSGEIGRILDISSHTVDWYMNGIQEKLKARNRSHVVATAFRIGLIN